MAETVQELRAVYARTLNELAAENPDIVVLEADLMKATGTGAFASAHPDRTINVGVAEATLVGVASGLSAEGKIPFAATFACFASRRAFDQFFLSANYARLNVKLVGTDPGVTAAFNGGTHMPLEDLALMRVIPGLRIVEPSDPVSLAAYLRLAAATRGCVYLRLQRKPAPAIYAPDEAFAWGEAKILRRAEGSGPADVLIIALGALMVGEALKAADLLAAEGVRATVMDALCLKPLDAGRILEQARICPRIVTAENHQASGGLGSAVAEIIADAGIAAHLARVGVQDEFGEVGTQDWLQERFGLTAARIAERARALLA
ncbi:MAG TPA: transketolase C-terminal domain-containing protein [Rectinemataceae bacterium]|nr:transketolase C-terminal domain-containing protein [Rectinemataceae bacterium]